MALASGTAAPVGAFALSLLIALSWLSVLSVFRTRESRVLCVGASATTFGVLGIIVALAHTECHHLVAGVVSDELLESQRGRGAIIPLSERLEIVQSTDRVDRAVAETNTDRLDTWRELGYDVFFKGDDWRGTQRGIDLEQRFAEVGVEVVCFPSTIDTSSTALRKAIAALDAPVFEVATG